MTDTLKDIIEGAVAIVLIGRGVISHYEHKRTNKDVNEIRIYMNGEFEKRLAEEKLKWEAELKTKK